MQNTVMTQPAALFILWMKPSLLSVPGRRRRLVLPAPWHFLERLKEIDKLSLVKGAEDPGFTGSNKTSAIGDKAIHRVRDACMLMPAGIDPVVPGKTSHVHDASHGRRG